MNACLAMEAVAAQEPYARRLVEKAAARDDAYRAKWFLALEQAHLVLVAYDAEPDANLQSANVGTP